MGLGYRTPEFTVPRLCLRQMSKLHLQQMNSYHT